MSGKDKIEAAKIAINILSAKDKLHLRKVNGIIKEIFGINVAIKSLDDCMAIMPDNWKLYRIQFYSTHNNEYFVTLHKDRGGAISSTNKNIAIALLKSILRAWIQEWEYDQ